ncbi:MAG: TFIIB-type zinc ribbon-containing protein [Planctomycetota bacterium]|jgi:Zn-finger nucleic acid-binding protein
MNCPVCKEPMITMELDNVEIDYCLGCHGIWLDAGELEMFLDGAEGKDRFLASFQKDTHTNEIRRKCPICLRKMHKVQTGESEPKVLIDRCRKGHGLWLDKGELKEIIENHGSGEAPELLDLLTDMFGMRKG